MDLFPNAALIYYMHHNMILRGEVDFGEISSWSFELVIIDRDDAYTRLSIKPLRETQPQFALYLNNALVYYPRVRESIPIT
jgi:hypothetical protein